MQFRDWGGMYMEHCHNTVHEDNAMLTRWDINRQAAVPLLAAEPLYLRRPDAREPGPPKKVTPS